MRRLDDHGPGCDGPLNCVCGGSRLPVTASRRFDVLAGVAVAVFVAAFLFVTCFGVRARASAAPVRWMCWSEVNHQMPDGVEPMCAWVVQK